MSISEQILLSLSRAPTDTDYSPRDGETTPDNALRLLNRVYPNFASIVAGKRVADFGCGVGQQSIALVKKHGCSVFGIDANPRTLEKATQNAKANNISSNNLTFVKGISPDMLGTFDVVISHNSFEHFDNPVDILDAMRSLLNDSGVILLTFGPPWLAPYGSHMNFFCKIPWINVLFPESAVMKVRSRYRHDGAKRYEDVESGLNRMTVSKFERIVSSSNLKFVQKNYECIKGINMLAKLPLLREFFINHVTAVLAKGKA
jgi:SAM-dependent methyltransferase